MTNQLRDEQIRITDLPNGPLTNDNGDVRAIKYNLSASTAPTGADNFSEGYSLGSLWIYAGAIWACAGDGVWLSLGPIDDVLIALAGLSMTKGDLIVGTASGSVERLPVGADPLPLVADSSQPLGLTYKPLPIAGGGTGETTGEGAVTALIGDVSNWSEEAIESTLIALGFLPQILSVAPHYVLATDESPEVVKTLIVAPGVSYTTSSPNAADLHHSVNGAGDVELYAVNPTAGDWDFDPTGLEEVPLTLTSSVGKTLDVPIKVSSRPAEIGHPYLFAIKGETVEIAIAPATSSNSLFRADYRAFSPANILIAEFIPGDSPAPAKIRLTGPNFAGPSLVVPSAVAIEFPNLPSTVDVLNDWPAITSTAPVISPGSVPATITITGTDLPTVDPGMVGVTGLEASYSPVSRTEAEVSLTETAGLTAGVHNLQIGPSELGLSFPVIVVNELTAAPLLLLARSSISSVSLGPKPTAGFYSETLLTITVNGSGFDEFSLASARIVSLSNTCYAETITINSPTSATLVFVLYRDTAEVPATAYFDWNTGLQEFSLVLSNGHGSEASSTVHLNNQGSWANWGDWVDLRSSGPSLTVGTATSHNIQRDGFTDFTRNADFAIKSGGAASWSNAFRFNFLEYYRGDGLATEFVIRGDWAGNWMIGVGSRRAGLNITATYANMELLLYGPSSEAGTLRGIYSNNGSLYDDTGNISTSSVNTPLSTATGNAGSSDIWKVRIEDHQITMYRLTSGTWDSPSATWDTIGTWGLPAGAAPDEPILAPVYCGYSNSNTRFLGVRVVPV